MLQPSLPTSARPLASQIFIASEGQLWAGRAGKHINLASGSGWVTSDEITKSYAGDTLIGVMNYVAASTWGFYWSLMGIEIID